MTITFLESGMLFGPYETSRVFHIEKSALYHSIGSGSRVIEFVLSDLDDRILMIEAKASSPKPNNLEDFDGFITEIGEKFVHSLDLFFSVIMQRLTDVNKEVPAYLRSADYSKVKIILILVINGHKIEWLGPIRTALEHEIKRQIKVWRLKIAVLNHELALEFGLLDYAHDLENEPR